jgi:hypothetical protein
MLDPNRPQSLDALTGSLARALAGVRSSQLTSARRAARHASVRAAAAASAGPATSATSATSAISGTSPAAADEAGLARQSGGYRNVISSSTHLADRHRTYLLLGTLGELRRGSARWTARRGVGGAAA